MAKKTFKVEIEITVADTAQFHIDRASNGLRYIQAAGNVSCEVTDKGIAAAAKAGLGIRMGGKGSKTSITLYEPKGVNKASGLFGAPQAKGEIESQFQKLIVRLELEAFSEAMVEKIKEYSDSEEARADIMDAMSDAGFKRFSKPQWAIVWQHVHGEVAKE